MEKVLYDIDFNIKNNPSEQLREVNQLLLDLQANTQSMAGLMSQQVEMMRSPIDDMRESWLNVSGDAGAFFAVLSENTAGIVNLIEIETYLDELGVTTKLASAIQNSYNSVIATGREALNAYQARVIAANAAISTTTGATRALNMVIAASPYIIAAAAATALAIGIYKIATSSSQTDEAQKRLNDTLVGMHTEVAKETTALDRLFAPLNNAKVGSEEWQKAKDGILAKYGNYLSQIEVEITSVDTARLAYNKLNQAIVDTARARAMEKATSGAGDAYAQTEGDALKKIRQQLYSGIGSGAGKITATQAGKAWAQIREAVRSGKDIPQEAQQILEQTQTSYTDRWGTHTINPIANYIYRLANDVRQARGVYTKEIADANAMYGGSKGPLLNNAPTIPVTPAVVTPPAVTPRVDNSYAASSLTALEASLSKLKKKQKDAPIETQLTFTQDIAQMEKPIKNAMQPSLGRTRKEGGLSDLKLQTPELDMEEPLSSMVQWNAAVEAARENNINTIDSLGAMGNAMGTLGSLVGGAAGQWLDWAGNLLNAIAQALPQLAALATANTATAATGAASSVASIPIVGPILAVAAVASILGALVSLPKFANGGIAYGPTLGLFGEYAGASNNPEVVAPLNKLRQLIQPAGPSGISGDVRFRLEGRTLVGVIEREMNLNRRS